MTKIFSVFHKEYFYAENEVITPIQTGVALAKEKLPMINDAIGDSISYKNKSYGEFTSLYWIWKNYFPRPDYIGHCHYRRYFLFDEKYCDKANMTSKNPNDILMLENTLFGENQINSAVDKWDIILPQLSKIGNTRLQYAKYHHIEHFDKMIEIMKKLHPEESNIIDTVSNESYLYLCCMFVMKKEIFEEYMEFLFEILFELENIIEIPSDSYQQRVFAFLGERILNYFVQIYKSKKMIKIKHYPVLFLDYDLPDSKFDRLNFGENYEDGYLNIAPFENGQKADIVNTLEKLFFEKNILLMASERSSNILIKKESFNQIKSRNILQMLEYPNHVIYNFMVLLRKNGEIEIEVPYDLSLKAWEDFRTKRAFNETSFNYVENVEYKVGENKFFLKLLSIELKLSQYGIELKNNKNIQEIDLIKTPRAIDSMILKFRKVQK